MLVRIELQGVRLEVPSQSPVMMLQESGEGGRVLPIYIGAPEASAIHYATEGIVPERPLTHDLLVNVVRGLGAEFSKIVITEVRDHTYFADLHLSIAGSEVVISARPSDAVAVAVRTETPIFASESLLKEVAKSPVAASGESEEEILDDFREFINSINPEDFEG
jgi:bifunctional DNase/RNase